MAIRTRVAPSKQQEVFSETDRSEIHGIISELRRSYVTRLHEATFELNRAQRQVNRASHEVSRLERHLSRIDSFCEKNNIPLDAEEE